ncbi:hypothetical protein ACTFIW_006033 [Dictyostelium discoideum]
MVKRKFFQNNLSKDLISHKLESKNCGSFIITTVHGNNVTLDLVGYPEKHNVFNKNQIVKLYEDSDWLRVESSIPNGTKEKIELKNRKRATTEAAEPIVSSPLSQEVQNYKPLHPISTRQQNQQQQIKEINKRKENQETKVLRVIHTSSNI